MQRFCDDTRAGCYLSTLKSIVNDEIPALDSRITHTVANLVARAYNKFENKFILN